MRATTANKLLRKYKAPKTLKAILNEIRLRSKINYSYLFVELKSCKPKIVDKLRKLGYFVHRTKSKLLYVSWDNKNE